MNNPSGFPPPKGPSPDPGPHLRAAEGPPQIELPLHRSTPAECRAFAQQVLVASGRFVPRDVVDGVMIVVAELVTASYLGGGSRVRVAIEVRDRDLTVTVGDDRPDDWQGQPAPHDTREMLLDALTVERRASIQSGETVHLARLLLTAA